jgi:hypothetical protein
MGVVVLATLEVVVLATFVALEVAGWWWQWF